MATLTMLAVPSDDPGAAAEREALVQRLTHRRFLGEYDDTARAHEAAVAHVARLEPRARLLRVVEGVADGGDPGAVVRGHVWLVEQGDDLALVDVTLDDTALGPQVRELTEQVARAAGARRLTAVVSPGDLVAEAFVAGGGFETSAVQMRLPLDDRLPTAPRVVLAPMDQAAFALWEADEIETYAAAREKAGETHERALEVSREQHAELLPDGLRTEHHHFFVGLVEGEQVGTLWIGTERPMAFVYDVVVDEAHRRQGYGAGLMRAGAVWARERGAHAIGLNVFGYNHAARALYDRLGYHATEVFLGRVLET